MKKWEFGLVSLATLLSLPFLIATPLRILLGLAARLFPQGPPALIVILDMPFFLVTMLLSDVTRYLGISLAALALTLVALAWLVVRERAHVWQHKGFQLLTVPLVAVLLFPLLMHYQPAVKALPGVELRVVEKPGLLTGAVKSCQTAAEVYGCQYEPLGWVNAQVLVYRRWCGGHYTEEGWQPGEPRPLQSYHLSTDEVLPFNGDPAQLSRMLCSACVTPSLAKSARFDAGYFPGRYEDKLVSPDRRWVAFTARHPAYGPEDLLIVSIADD